MKVLLVHHTPPHFETLVAFHDALRGQFEVSIWSNSLPWYDRAGLLKQMGASLFEVGGEFDVAIIISYDEPFTTALCPPFLHEKILSGPLVKVLHRYHGVSEPDQIHLFPTAPNAFIPASSGMSAGWLKPPLGKSRKFLIQGNVERRRNYSSLANMASAEGDFLFYVVGKRVQDLGLEQPKVRLYYDLTEIEFRVIGASCDFIFPMIDPMGYSGYFIDRFSSSLQAGYAFNLPFVAHKRLFDLYPIAGLAYENDRELLDCLHDAIAMSPDQYAALTDDLVAKRNSIHESNRRTLTRVIASAVQAGKGRRP